MLLTHITTYQIFSPLVKWWNKLSIHQLPTAAWLQTNFRENSSFESWTSSSSSSWFQHVVQVIINFFTIFILASWLVFLFLYLIISLVSISTQTHTHTHPCCLFSGNEFQYFAQNQRIPYQSTATSILLANFNLNWYQSMTWCPQCNIY